MRDPWKYVAFPAAAIGGFVLSSTSIAAILQNSAGLNQYISQLVVVAVSGLISGFMVDEVIPAYIEKVRGENSEMGGGDFGSGGDFGGDDSFGQ